MSYKAIFKKTVETNNAVFLFLNLPIHLFVFRQLSFFLTPFFIMAKFSPNVISSLGLFVGLISTGLIGLGSNDYFSISIFLYLFAIVLDFCDGNVARITNNSTYFGRFLDGVIDIVLCCALRLALTSVALYKFQNETLMWLGIICTVLTPFHHLYFDRYSAFCRWIKEETKIDIKPYLRLFPGLNSILLDVQFVCIILFPLMIENKNFIYLCSLYFIIHIFLGLLYICFHTLYSYNYMRISASKHR